MIVVSARSQFAPHVLAHGGETHTGKDGKDFVIAGLEKTVAVWRNSTTKTYTDSEGKKIKRTTLSHYAAVVNDIGEIKPLCYHRQIVPENTHDPLHGTFRAQVSAPLDLVVKAEKKIAAEIARTLMFGAADTIIERTFRYGDRVRLIGMPAPEGYGYRMVGKSLLVPSQFKIVTSKIGATPSLHADPLYVEGNKVRNLRLSPTHSDDFFGIAAMLVEIIGIEGYYREPLNVRDICRAMTRHYAAQKTATRLLTTSKGKETSSTSSTLTTTASASTATASASTKKTGKKITRKPTTVAGSEIAEGIQDNAQPTDHARGNAQDSQPIKAGVDPANATRQTVAPLPYGNGTTL